MEKDKILVTGGAGYIGSHTIVELLNDKNYEVISVDNFIKSRPSSYDRIKELTQETVKSYNIDLCDKEKLEMVFKENKDISGIIHFAALKSVPESVNNPVLYYKNNINSLLNLLELSDKFNVRSFIFSSSCSVYGNVDSLPVTEKTKLNKAESPYAYTKQVGEVIINDFLKTSPVKAIALRYFNPVGAHMSGKLGEDPIDKPNNLLPVITKTAIGQIKKMTVFGSDYKTRDGSCVRDYIHVTDIARAHIQAYKYSKSNGMSQQFDLFNLGSGNGVTTLEAVNSFEKNTGIKLNYEVGDRREGDVEAIYSNSDKAKELLGWIPQFNIDDMMISAWKWEKYLQKNS